MDSTQLQQAIFGLHTRRFGTVAEIMIKKIIRADNSDQLSFDLFDMVGFCRMNSTAKTIYSHPVISAVLEGNFITIVYIYF